MQSPGDAAGNLSTPFLLKDGRSVALRHIRPADADLLLDFYAGLSPEARRQRFFHIHRVTAEESRGMAAIEDDNGVAIAAVAGDGTIVADARCVTVRNSGNTGEDEPPACLAIAVRDDYQRVGLGTLLLDELVTAAASAGITTLVAEILGDNLGMRQLLSSRHFVVAGRDGSSMVQAIFRTDGRVPVWPDDTPSPRVLIETHSWYGSMQERYLRDAGYSVMVCPGPHQGRSCDLLATGSCELVEGADAIICSNGDDEDRNVLAAHQASPASIPLLVTVGSGDSPSLERAEAIWRSGSADELISVLDRHGIPRPVQGDIKRDVR